MKQHALIAGAIFGAVLALPGLAQEADAPNGVASGVEGVAAVVVRVSDLEDAEGFYEHVLGVVSVRHAEMDAYSETVYAFPGGEGAKLVLVESHVPETEHSEVRVVFSASVAATPVAAALANGATIVRDATPVPGIDGLVIGIVKDPDGNTLEFIQRDSE